VRHVRCTGNSHSHLARCCDTAGCTEDHTTHLNVWHSNGLLMSDTRINLKLHEETFEQLKDDKPSGVTWDFYLLALHTTGSLPTID